MKVYTVKVFENKVVWYNTEGKLHRENGPAVEYTDGHKEWRINGNLHREDGPAIERDDGDKEYWYKHNRINCSTDKEYFKLIKMKAFW